MFGSVLSFQLEREVFLREQANKMYSPTCYFISKNLLETPFATIGPLMFLMIIYWMAGIIEFGRYFLAMLLMSQVSLGMGLFLSALAPNVVVATALTPALAMPM